MAAAANNSRAASAVRRHLEHSVPRSSELAPRRSGRRPKARPPSGEQRLDVRLLAAEDAVL
ncbi:MAG: hypothetical protein ACJ736_35250, partial [Streptomyces sp.]